MIVNLVDLNEGKVFNFDFYEKIDINCLNAQNAEPIDDMRISGHLYKKDSEVVIVGTIQYTLAFNCDWCLKKSQKAILQEMDLHIEKYESEKLDLSKVAQEELLYLSPSVLVCSDDCKGLCPVCGVNLNLEKCEHSENISEDVQIGKYRPFENLGQMIAKQEGGAKDGSTKT